MAEVDWVVEWYCCYLALGTTGGEEMLSGRNRKLEGLNEKLGRLRWRKCKTRKCLDFSLELPFMTVIGETGSDVGEGVLLSGVDGFSFFFHGEVSGVGCSLMNVIACSRSVPIESKSGISKVVSATENNPTKSFSLLVKRAVQLFAFKCVFAMTFFHFSVEEASLFLF